MTKIIKLTKTNQDKVIQKTIEVLLNDGLVDFPSDTVYGLLADATNPKAVDKLLSFKERKPGHAISVFVSDKNMAEKYVVLNQNAENVINNLLPGPFTVVCKSKHKTDLRLEAENGTLGIRIPNFPLINNLVNLYGKPITATSANLSGLPANYSVSSLLHAISEKKKNMLDLVIDGGTLPKHKPSTVIDTTSGELKTLRLGDWFPSAPNKLISKSEEETIELGRFLATKFIKKSLSKPIIFLLQGELGTGKTILTKGIGKTLKIKEEIISPTYTLSYEYDSPLTPKSISQMIDIDVKGISHSITNELTNNIKLIHYDLYRIESPEELKELKFIENFVCGNIYVIEWPERIPEKLISALKKSAEIAYISLKHLAENTREICWTTIGN